MATSEIDAVNPKHSDSASRKLPFKEKAGYALGIHGIMYFWYATNLYLFYFYTDVVGLTPAQRMAAKLHEKAEAER